MVKKHLKRIAAPKTWKVKRKTGTWITRPRPGAHPLNQCITLDYVIREQLKHANTYKEAKKCIKAGNVLVDAKPRRDHKFSVGIMDVITIKDQDEHYRVVLNDHNQLVLQKIPEKQATLKLCKIVGKTIIKKKKIQLNLHDSKNVITTDDKIKVGDSIVLDLKTGKIKEHFVFEKGNSLYLTGGKHPGVIGFLEGEKKQVGLQPDVLLVKAKEDVFETAKQFAFIVGKGAPALVIRGKDENDKD
ncbi:30S ribosomal protein S4e [archaeon]|nr:30S ribosomal protein S4e [archaeon]|tara:strand:+ start:628 stop:1359 length:732 start_codon:yes stop_codon:yes gene_type:complete